MEKGGEIAGAIAQGPALIVDRLAGWVTGFQKLLPNIVAALIVLAIFVSLAALARSGIRKWAYRRQRENLGDVLGGFIRWVVIISGIFIGLTIILPNLNPSDLIAGLGIGSVAIGFAFKDILQNWLAGLLLLVRNPFSVGDQIIVRGYEGTVERIEQRATIIKTYDGRSVIVPNADVYSSSVTVNTAHPVRRSQYDFMIGNDEDPAEVRALVLKELQTIDGVETEPKPDVLVWDLGDWAVKTRVRWWTNSHRTDVVKTHAAVLERLKAAFEEADIDLPYPISMTLQHDLTREAETEARERAGEPRERAADEEPRQRNTRMRER